MLTLNNKTLSYDRAFSHNGIQYPANWLRLASLEEKQAIGIKESSNPATYDQRFYWGLDNPKDLDQLKTQWSNTQEQIAASLLAPSDWVIIKAKETSSHIPAAWRTYRAAVRAACNTRQTEISNAADVPALKELLFGNATVTDADGNETTNPAIATAWPTPI